ncbi:hypothetical protein AN958_08966 [Leucoagaricus sp. SymC.cos]|nr:hypothetical protein AN958_08966 [Leucoagaricus sp. SymC.cos]
MATINKSVFERIDKNKACLLVIDHQVGLFHMVKDIPPAEFKNNILAHASMAKLFGIPVILTTSAESGPNGPLPQEILDMYPNIRVIRRDGEVNAWDCPEFRTAVKATGRTQFIVGGIVTEVCTTFVAMSLAEQGYTVYANADASGTGSVKAAEHANERMRSAGIHVYSMFAIVCDLMRDWRHSPGATEVMPWLDRYMPSYGYLQRAHGAAVKHGKVQPGQHAPERPRL